MPSNTAWEKWCPCTATSAYWYDLQRLQRYIAAHVARDQDRGYNRTVREFISEIRGFSGSAKQKLVLDDTGLTRAALASLFDAEGNPEVEMTAGHRQVVGCWIVKGAMDYSTVVGRRDHAAMATPVTSAQVANAWRRAE